MNDNTNDQAVILVGGKPYVPKGTGVDTWIMDDLECVPKEESVNQPHNVHPQPTETMVNTHNEEWVPKVGDWVQVKEWDDLIKNLVEIPGAHRSISYGTCFVPSMKKFCGGKYTITALIANGTFTLNVPIMAMEWVFCKDFVIPCDPPSPIQEESFKVGQRVRVKSREEVSKHQEALNRMSFNSIRTILKVYGYGIDLGDGYIYDKESLLPLCEGAEESIHNDLSNPFHEFSTDALRQAITIIKLIKHNCLPMTLDTAGAMIQSEINRRLSKGENQ